MRGMIEAAHEIGLEAAGVKTDIRTLTQDPRVAILLLNVGANGHYVILDRIENGSVRLLDGRKFRNLSVGQLKSVWDGYAILVGEDPDHKGMISRSLLGTGMQVSGSSILIALVVCCLWRTYRWVCHKRPHAKM